MSQRMQAWSRPRPCGRERRWQRLLFSTCAAALLFLAGLPGSARAQEPVIGTPLPPIDSPLFPATPTPSPTATAIPTDTPSPTPSATPTIDLATAVLQVSPLRLTPDDRPMQDFSALLVVVSALLLVLAGAIVMAVAQTRQ